MNLFFTNTTNVDSSVDCRFYKILNRYLSHGTSTLEYFLQDGHHQLGHSSRQSLPPFIFLATTKCKMWSWPSNPVYFNTTELCQNAKFSSWLIVTVGTAIFGLWFAHSEFRHRLVFTNPTARKQYRWSVFYILYHSTWANISEGNTKDQILDTILLHRLDHQCRRMYPLGSAPGSIV